MSETERLYDSKSNRSSDSAISDEYEVVTNASFLANENARKESGSHSFHNIFYLGQRDISNPKSERDIHAQIAQAISDNDEAEVGEVDVIVPFHVEGSVQVMDSKGKTLLYSPVNRINFFARGEIGTSESCCFAFTLATASPSSSSASVSFKTHIFRCDVEDVVAEVFAAFAHAFKKQTTPTSVGQESFLFDVSMEVKESDSHNGFEFVPRQRKVFKLRKDVEKKVVLTVSTNRQLGIERCFGMLVSPGQNVRHADMQLLDQVSLTGGDQAYVISGHWDPKESAFAMLNKETPQDVQSVYLTIAVDLVMNLVSEPVRFVIETRARIYPKTEKHWYFTRKALVKQYRVWLKRREEGPESNGNIFELVRVDVGEEVDQVRGKKSLSLHLASLTASTFGSIRSTSASTHSAEEELTVEDDDTDDGDPMLSGFGEVSKECSGNELDVWSRLLREWDKLPPPTRPKSLQQLVRTVGVPEALRGEVWQRITGASCVQDEIVDAYRILITKESPDDKVILRDTHRTFPAHDFFKDVGGTGQESLYRIAKAYSIYDSEIGYCQGQSFLIAALLLQMPEEQTFGVFVKVMHQLHLRHVFRENFEHLQMRLHQLDKLLEVHLPDLWSHFQECGIESHMYASQWFLTVFTAKFPLFLVFRVLDVFLLEGFEFVFQVALGLLKVAKRDLMSHNFEGLMKYFRVNLPKAYRKEDNVKFLMSVVSQIKLKKLKKYEKEWLAMKAAEKAREDPVVRLERENKKLLNETLRLDTENDNLARELVNSKIEMRQEIDAVEDAKDMADKELEGIKQLLDESVEERKRLEGESEQLKSLLKREIDKFDSELARTTNVIAEYKTICSQLSEKLERAQLKSSPFPPPTTNATGDGGANSVVVGDDEADGSIDCRVKVLELELAKTKLALVETECKNQDLVHQLATVQDGQLQTAAVTRNYTWFSKTLSSIRESASPTSSPSGVGNNPTMVRSASMAGGGVKAFMPKSSSIDGI